MENAILRARVKHCEGVGAKGNIRLCSAIDVPLGCEDLQSLEEKN